MHLCLYAHYSSTIISSGRSCFLLMPIFIGERNSESEDRQRKHKIFFSSCVGTPPQGADWLFRISAKSGNILCLAFTPHSPSSHYPREKLHIWGGSLTVSGVEIIITSMKSLDSFKMQLPFLVALGRPCSIHNHSPRKAVLCSYLGVPALHCAYRPICQNEGGRLV